jgi:hypothetical protein
MTSLVVTTWNIKMRTVWFTALKFRKQLSKDLQTLLTKLTLWVRANKYSTRNFRLSQRWWLRVKSSETWCCVYCLLVYRRFRGVSCVHLQSRSSPFFTHLIPRITECLYPEPWSLESRIPVGGSKLLWKVGNRLLIDKIKYFGMLKFSKIRSFIYDWLSLL